MTVHAVGNEQGSYRADPLAAGRYRLETTLDGFETAVREAVLETGQTAAIEVTLTPARFTPASMWDSPAMAEPSG